MKTSIFLIPIFIIFLSFIPLWFLLKQSRQPKIKKSTKVAKKLMLLHYVLLFGLIIGTTVLMSITKATHAMGQVANPQNVTIATQGLALCFKYISSAIAVGVGCIGAGIGIGNGISAAIGAYSENEKTFSKSLMFVAFGEGIAIYGLVVAFLILFVA